MNFWLRIPVQRRKRLILFVVAAVIVVGTLWAARSVLGLYFIGLVLAYMLAPVVDLLQSGLEWITQRKWLRFFHKRARAFSILVTYLLLVAVIAGFIALVVPLITNEAQELWNARESLWGNISRFAEDIFQQYQLLPDQIRLQIDDALAQLMTFLTNVLQQAVQGTVVAITFTTSVVLGISIVPFWTFYLLRDFTQIRRSLAHMIPGIVRVDVGNIVRLLDHTLSAYLRGQILLCIIIGVMTTIVMTILGIPYALLLGVLAGILEVIPNIGPTLAAIPAILLALARGPWWWALVTAGACNLIQNVENSVIVPRILGDSVGLHPVLMMVMLVVGTEIGGLPGLFLAPILTAVLRDLYKYLHYRFSDVPLSPQGAMQIVYDDAPFSIEI